MTFKHLSTLLISLRLSPKWGEFFSLTCKMSNRVNEQEYFPLWIPWIVNILQSGETKNNIEGKWNVSSVIPNCSFLWTITWAWCWEEDCYLSNKISSRTVSEYCFWIYDILNPKKILHLPFLSSLSPLPHQTPSLLLPFLSHRDRLSLCSPGGPELSMYSRFEITDITASASWVLGLKVCTTMPSLA